MKNLVLVASVALIGQITMAQTSGQPRKGPLMTRWTADVSPETVSAESPEQYPRPQLVRRDWSNLNGLWEYAILPRDAKWPADYDGHILVPFPVESALSGVMQRVPENQRLWYRRRIDIPAAWSGQRLLLQFGAVDWEASVWINGQSVGTHRGGYDPFTFEITAAMKEPGPQEIVVAVWDPTDAGEQPRGKQVHKPEGIWYTPTTGIWQTVWLEPVPDGYIEDLKIVPDVDAGLARLSVKWGGVVDRYTVKATARADGKVVATASGSPRTSLDLRISEPKLWSPASPFLYDLTVTLLRDGKPVDEVASYFGMRKVSIGKDKQGTTRILLNNEPLFMYGTLDQGFWPDGLYAAPSDDALRYDIEITRQLGFNMIRKHVKIEPQRWYAWCDKIGLLVWQDMPSGNRSAAPGHPDIERTKESAAQFEFEMKQMIDHLHDHPSIVMWIPFNEGWGQYDTRRITQWVKQTDPTRLVNCASGWNDRGVGDVFDIHAYPGPASPNPEPTRAAVLGEFGGLGLPIAGHTWQDEKNWGYRSFASSAELTEAYVGLVRSLRHLITEPGLSAAVYTQTTDVEIEVNGLLTYDRAQVKIDQRRAADANRQLYQPPPIIEIIAPSAQERPTTWRYTTDAPPNGWFEPSWDDSVWSSGPGGFGRDGTPGIVIGTKWLTSDIWLRRSFELKDVPANVHLKLYHDEDCQVFLNGVQVAAPKGYTTCYKLFPVSGGTLLKPGRNLIAIHCHQTTGGQGVDAGLASVREPESR